MTMARHEADREDLLREATAMPRRIELQLSQFPESVFIGFRGNGAASWYFGGEPVYQFNPQQELRRVFAHGVLWKAESGTLHRMQRQRTAQHSMLLSKACEPQEQNQLLLELHQQLATVWQSLQSGQYRIVGQHPIATDLIPEILAWCESLPEPVRVALSPHVTGGTCA
jgi:hypothetical protein